MVLLFVIRNLSSRLVVQIAELVATEFFEQGDKEREELNIEPIVSTVVPPNNPENVESIVVTELQLAC